MQVRHVHLSPLVYTNASTHAEPVACLQNFCEKAMGSRYVNQDAFSPSVVMGEASSSTPIFFILFPGYSPSKEIEAYAREVNHTVENGKLTLISMGQVSSIFAFEHVIKTCLDHNMLCPPAIKLYNHVLTYDLTQQSRHY